MLLKICLFIACVISKVRVEDDVLVLTDQNFDSEIAKHDKILVEFYAPWCGHCKKLAPEYAKAAKLLKKADPPIPIAKVDATINKKLKARFEIKAFPSIFWFENGAKKQ